MTWRDIPRNPSLAKLRQFAILWLVIFGLVGYLRYQQGEPRLGIALMILAVLGGVAGFVAPRAIRPIFVGWLIAAFPTGWLVSHALLAFVFVFLVAPLGFVFRRLHRDARHLRPSDASTYWKAKPAPGDVASYYRQF